ncbi:hypothetical protein PtB15_15B328 [Puccinia triticina]|nr:hypothetical protein PtB15_15B328 [Puccinia triticina]
MRVSCLFVSVAIMLAGEIQSLPVLGLGSLPFLGNDGQLVDTVSNTLHPVTGNLTGNLLDVSADGDVLSEVDLVGDEGLLSSEGPLGGIVGSLRRRQGLMVLDTLGSVANGVQVMSVLGSVGSILPVTQALTSQVGGLSGGLHKSAPVPALPVGLTSLLKRDSTVNSLPLVGSIPGASSLPSLSKLPLISSLPSFSSLPLISSVPSFSSLPLISSVPSFSSLPLISSVPGISKLSSGLPSPASLGSLL